MLVRRRSALWEEMPVVFGLADQPRQARILVSVPTSPFGLTTTACRPGMAGGAEE